MASRIYQVVIRHEITFSLASERNRRVSMKVSSWGPRELVSFNLSENSNESCDQSGAGPAGLSKAARGLCRGARRAAVATIALHEVIDSDQTRQAGRFEPLRAAMQPWLYNEGCV